ncbi:hypothetical protein TWF281_005305 [Arthrobotrys megalospora]
MSSESSPEPPQLVDLASEMGHTEAFGALGDLELEFEKAEVEVLKYQIKTTTPLYARRNLLTTSIPSFWPTVFDSTPDFDQHIAPEDVAAISIITSLNVIRPNVDEPRDFIIELGFDKSRNEWFEGDVLRKQFWWRTVEGVWSGLVSEPVEVKWKEGKDLSKGETGRVYAEWKGKRKGGKEEKGKGKGKGKVSAAASSAANGKKKEKLSLEERLAGGQPSFFTWFAWMGKGTEYGLDGKEVEEEEDDDEESDDLFNHGDELALTIADDVYPNAIKYFLESVTGDEEVDSDMSVSELDSDEEIVVIGGEEEEDDSEEDGIGGSSRVKRADITLDSEDEDEDEGNRRRKRVKK